MKKLMLSLIALALVAAALTSVHADPLPSGSPPGIKAKKKMAAPGKDSKSPAKTTTAPKRTPKRFAPKTGPHIDVSVSSDFTVSGSGFNPSVEVSIRVTRLDTLRSVFAVTTATGDGTFSYPMPNPGNIPSGAILAFGASQDGGTTWSNTVQVSVP